MGCLSGPFIRQRHRKDDKKANRERGREDRMRKSISTCGSYVKGSFIVFKLRGGTLKRQLCYDPGKEGRGHCQSLAAEMRSFKHKI